MMVLVRFLQMIYGTDSASLRHTHNNSVQVLLARSPFTRHLFLPLLQPCNPKLLTMKLSLYLLCIVALCPTALAVELITNGGFELPLQCSGTSCGTAYTGLVNNWTYVGSGHLALLSYTWDYGGFGAIAALAGGRNQYYFLGNVGGSASQVMATSPSTQYTLTFWQGIVPSTPLAQLAVSVNTLGTLGTFTSPSSGWAFAGHRIYDTLDWAATHSDVYVHCGISHH